MPEMNVSFEYAAAALTSPRRPSGWALIRSFFTRIYGPQESRERERGDSRKMSHSAAEALHTCNDAIFFAWQIVYKILNLCVRCKKQQVIQVEITQPITLLKKLFAPQAINPHGNYA